MKINNFQGELTDISAKKEALLPTLARTTQFARGNVSLELILRVSGNAVAVWLTQVLMSNDALSSSRINMSSTMYDNFRQRAVKLFSNFN